MVATILKNRDWHKIQQIVKWSVYTLLLINWAFYMYEDWTRAAHTLNANSTFFDVTTAFATSLDELAWFVLLFILELETYILEDKDWNPKVTKALQGVRIICIALIAHTVVAFTQSVIDYSPTQPIDEASHICDIADQGASYVYNLAYTEIRSDNCSAITGESGLYWAGNKDEKIVATLEGLELERDLAWADWIEVVVWLLVLATIEIVVRLQDRGIASGQIISRLNKLKLALYSILMGIGVYWAGLGHWVYLWDEFLWIGGFAAIELNISQWREEILSGHDEALAGENKIA